MLFRSIRAGAATAAEDETDLSKVRFDLERYRAYAKGFLRAAGEILTQKELERVSAVVSRQMKRGDAR